MGQKDKLKFGKKIPNMQDNSREKRNNLESKMDNYNILIKKLSTKYNISEKKAEEIIKRIEQKNINNFQKHDTSSEKNNLINQDIKIKSQNKQNIKKHIDITKTERNLNNNLSSNRNLKDESRFKDDKIIKSGEQDKLYPSQDVNSKFSNQASLSKLSLKKEFRLKENKFDKSPVKQDVDNIISDIIPDYNQTISIDLEHVDLTFEVANEKVDTLKELFIKSIKRQNSSKMKIHALKDISFKIYSGEKVGIIGFNGAGKSTLLNVIAGIYPPDKGLVKTNGNISPLLSLGSGFDYNYSGRKNIYLNGAVLGYEKKFLESKIDEIIEFSELGEFIDIPIKNYSSGMLAKLGFSIATSVKPDILIIDEILGVGDVNFKKKSEDKIRSLMDGGTTVLLVSHSIPQIRSICDKAIWIDNGQLKEFGEVNKVCDMYLKAAEKASANQLVNIQFR